MARDRSTSRNNRASRRRSNKVDEQAPLLSGQERDSSVAASYRSFPDHDSWSASSSTITPANAHVAPGINDQLPESSRDVEEVTPPNEGAEDENHVDITRLRTILMAMSLAVMLFLQASNISLLTTVQGPIAEDINALNATTWFFSSYLLAMSSAGPIYGKLSYIFATRWLIVIASIVLTLGALVSAVSHSLAPFLLGRVLGGIGAAGIMCVTQVIIQYVPTRRKGLAQGCLNTGYTTGVASGAIIAGALEPVLGWRSVFWFQLPLTLLAGFTLAFAMPLAMIGIQPAAKSKIAQSTLSKVLKIDYLGAVLLITSITLMLYGLASPNFDVTEIVVICLSLFLFLPLFVYQEVYRHPDPIVSVKVLSNRPILFSCLATLGYMMSRWMVLFYTPIYGTAVRGLHPAEAGAVLVPTNVGFALGSLLSGLVHIRRDGSFYAACLVVFLIFPGTLLWLALATTANVSLLYYWALLLLNGSCAGAGMNYTLAHIQHLVHTDVRLIAISIFFTFRGFAGTFGATIGGGVFSRALKGALVKRFDEQGMVLPHKLLRELLGSPRAVQSLSGGARTAAVDGYVDALRTLFLAGVGLALVTFVLQACTGWKGPDEDDKERVHDHGEENDTRAENGNGHANGRLGR